MRQNAVSETVPNHFQTYLDLIPAHGRRSHQIDNERAISKDQFQFRMQQPLFGRMFQPNCHKVRHSADDVDSGTPHWQHIPPLTSQLVPGQ